MKIVRINGKWHADFILRNEHVSVSAVSMPNLLTRIRQYQNAAYLGTGKEAFELLLENAVKKALEVDKLENSLLSDE